MRLALFVLLPWTLACAGLASSEPTDPRVPKSMKPPPSTPAPDRKAFRPLPEGEGCVPPGAYEVRHPDDRVPTPLVVEGEGPGRTLVVALHGGSGDARKIFSQTRWHAKAKVEGGIAVLAPHAQEMAGHGPHWNTGKFDSVVGPDAGRDDVAYLEALVAQAKAATCADRVLGVGFSNGGQMIHRLACQGTSLDAVVSSAGTLLVDPATCEGQVPLLSYVGDEDRVFDSSPLEGAGQPPVPESAAIWATLNGCERTPPDVEKTQHQTCTTWKGCDAPTRLCVVHDMPHAWPAPWGKGKPSVDATTEGWAWFLGLSE